jgi:hypothetical protein
VHQNLVPPSSLAEGAVYSRSAPPKAPFPNPTNFVGDRIEYSLVALTTEKGET